MSNFDMVEREKSQEAFKYNLVLNPEELDELENKQASFENLNFGFSTEYVSKLKQQLKDPHSFQLMVREGSDFVGYVAASEMIFPEYLYLSELFIEPKFSNQGIASSLVNKVINFAKKEGLMGVYTQTETENIPAQKLYEKLGFSRVDNPEWDGITYKIEFE